GPNVEIGDILLCTADGTAAGTQATVGASWTILQVNIDGAVIGPTVAIDGRVALFDGTSGKLLKQSAGALGDAAFKNTGTTAGTLAAGDDGRITGALQRSGGTMSGLLGISIGNAITRVDYQQWKPTDWGTGKPYLAITKGTDPQVWEVVLWDSVSSAG